MKAHDFHVDGERHDDETGTEVDRGKNHDEQRGHDLLTTSPEHPQYTRNTHVDDEHGLITSQHDSDQVETPTRPAKTSIHSTPGTPVRIHGRTPAMRQPDIKHPDETRTPAVHLELPHWLGSGTVRIR